MDQPLDLSISLTSPPQGSSPEAIASISVQCETLNLTHTGDLLINPLAAKEREDIRWYLEEYWKWPYEGFATRGKQTEALLTDLGKRLYAAVFGSPKAMSIVQAWRLQPGVQRQISILSDSPQVLSLPWELLHDEQGFLVLRTQNPVSILRRLPQSELAVLSTPFEPPLRILLVTARPDDTGFVDPRGIARELVDEVQGHVEQGTIAVEFLRPPTLSTLRTRLSNAKLPQAHVLHFDGHGTFDQQINAKDKHRLSDGKQGMLAFENDEGGLDLVKADDVAQVLQESGVRLAVLTACQSAMSATDDAFSSVAARLIQGGVNAVIAMSSSVLVASATHYVEAFYRALAMGISAQIAHERAQQALHDDPRRHLLRRLKDEEGKRVELRDWWVPHFYQQRPLILQPTTIRPTSKQIQQTPLSRHLSEEMPTAPRYGFSGRARELLWLERRLLRRKVVLIHGFGGVGKTALVCEAADWLTRTGMYAGACFVSFEHGGDAAWLLSVLGNFLGVYDGHYNPNDQAAALAYLKPILKEQPTLVIADNLESILSGGEVPLEKEARIQLWEVLRRLAEMETGVLLTSRTTNVGDKWQPFQDKTVRLPLQGLHPEDACMLASRLLDQLKIDRAHVPYAELRDLLAQLDYHPLAIQLVLPLLRERPLSRIKADFTALLPRFQDDTIMGRNRSLLASLDYSLRRLGEEQRVRLARLALFEGGANEETLLEVTEIPKGEWIQLRMSLKQAALLAVEHKALLIPFLRFHPVLAPYLHTQPGADDAALRERYVERYFALARYLYREDKRNPEPVRALMRRELPNLRQALELLLKGGKLNAASEMAECIIQFLIIFGLRREGDELRRQVDEALATVDARAEGMLTWAEWLHESGLGKDEYGRSDLHTASTRFANLLERIKALPESTALSQGSYEHCLTLLWLARCLRMSGHFAAAENLLREALAVIHALIKRQPDQQNYIRQRGALLADIGDVLRSQGRYAQAHRAYEEALEVATQQGDLRSQAVALGQLGTLTLTEKNYVKARTQYKEALDLFQYLGEPGMEAVVWHQLGMVAEAWEEWTEAERCYRKSLVLKEKQGDLASAISTCNELAIIAEPAGHPTEAEVWYKRALELAERVHSGGRLHAGSLNNLADLLVNEVRAARAPIVRLVEARGYAERALAILETLDASEEVCKPLHILAIIADLEGRAEAMRDYRRREREKFAAFAGNRYHTNRLFGLLIDDITAAARGDAQARAAVEADLQKFEVVGLHATAAIQRIWEGERDWHSLVEDLDGQNALLVLLVLENLVQSIGAPSAETQNRSPE